MDKLEIENARAVLNTERTWRELADDYRALVVGAGAAGVQAAHALRKAGADVLIMDQASDVGGIWAQGDGNSRFEATWDAYEFPEFPWPKELVPGHARPRAAAMQAYIKAYCKQFDLNRCMRLNARLVRLQQHQEGGSGNGTRWCAVYQDLHTQQQHELQVDYVVLCTGLFSTPYVPQFKGCSSFAGLQVHGCHVQNAEVASGKHVVVVGNGRTGMDQVVEMAEQTAKSVTVVRYKPDRSHAQTGHVSEPEAGVPLGVGAASLPAYYTTGSKVPSGAKPLKRRVRSNISKLERLYLSCPKLLSPDVPLDDEAVHGGQVYDDGKGTLLEDDSIRAVQGIIAEIKPDAVVLGDGTTLKCDIIVYCTGYRNSYSFLSPDLQRKLNMQPDGLFLYRNILPPGIDNLAFVGAEVCTFNNLVSCELQAQWLQHVLTGHIKLPSRDVMEEDVTRQMEWTRHVLPPGRNRAAVLLWYQQAYHDQLQQEIAGQQQQVKDYTSPVRSQASSNSGASPQALPPTDEHPNWPTVASASGFLPEQQDELPYYSIEPLFMHDLPTDPRGIGSVHAAASAVMALPTGTAAGSQPNSSMCFASISSIIRAHEQHLAHATPTDQSGAHGAVLQAGARVAMLQARGMSPLLQPPGWLGAGSGGEDSLTLMAVAEDTADFERLTPALYSNSTADTWVKASVEAGIRAGPASVGLPIGVDTLELTLQPVRQAEAQVQSVLSQGEAAPGSVRAGNVPVGRMPEAGSGTYAALCDAYAGTPPLSGDQYQSAGLYSVATMPSEPLHNSTTLQILQRHATKFRRLSGRVIPSGSYATADSLISGDERSGLLPLVSRMSSMDSMMLGGWLEGGEVPRVGNQGMVGVMSQPIVDSLRTAVEQACGHMPSADAGAAQSAGATGADAMAGTLPGGMPLGPAAVGTAESTGRAAGAAAATAADPCAASGTAASLAAQPVSADTGLPLLPEQAPPASRPPAPDSTLKGVVSAVPTPTPPSSHGLWDNMVMGDSTPNSADSNVVNTATSNFDTQHHALARLSGRVIPSGSNLLPIHNISSSTSTPQQRSTGSEAGAQYNQTQDYLISATGTVCQSSAFLVADASGDIPGLQGMRLAPGQGHKVSHLVSRSIADRLGAWPQTVPAAAALARSSQQPEQLPLLYFSALQEACRLHDCLLVAHTQASEQMGEGSGLGPELQSDSNRQFRSQGSPILLRKNAGSLPMSTSSLQHLEIEEAGQKLGQHQEQEQEEVLLRYSRAVQEAWLLHDILAAQLTASRTAVQQQPAAGGVQLPSQSVASPPAAPAPAAATEAMNLPGQVPGTESAGHPVCGPQEGAAEQEQGVSRTQSSKLFMRQTGRVMPGIPSFGGLANDSLPGYATHSSHQQAPESRLAAAVGRTPQGVDVGALDLALLQLLQSDLVLLPELMGATTEEHSGPGNVTLNSNSCPHDVSLDTLMDNRPEDLEHAGEVRAEVPQGYSAQQSGKLLLRLEGRVAPSAEGWALQGSNSSVSFPEMEGVQTLPPGMSSVHVHARGMAAGGATGMTNSPAKAPATPGTAAAAAATQAAGTKQTPSPGPGRTPTPVTTSGLAAYSQLPPGSSPAPWFRSLPSSPRTPSEADAEATLHNSMVDEIRSALAGPGNASKAQLSRPSPLQRSNCRAFVTPVGTPGQVSPAQTPTERPTTPILPSVSSDLLEQWQQWMTAPGATAVQDIQGPTGHAMLRRSDCQAMSSERNVQLHASPSSNTMDSTNNAVFSREGTSGFMTAMPQGLLEHWLKLQGSCQDDEEAQPAATAAASCEPCLDGPVLPSAVSETTAVVSAAQLAGDALQSTTATAPPCGAAMAATAAYQRAVARAADQQDHAVEHQGEGDTGRLDDAGDGDGDGHPQASWQWFVQAAAPGSDQDRTDLSRRLLQTSPADSGSAHDEAAVGAAPMEPAMAQRGSVGTGLLRSAASALAGPTAVARPAGEESGEDEWEPAISNPFRKLSILEPPPEKNEEAADMVIGEEGESEEEEGEGEQEFYSAAGQVSVQKDGSSATSISRLSYTSAYSARSDAQAAPPRADVQPTLAGNPGGSSLEARFLLRVGTMEGNMFGDELGGWDMKMPDQAEAVTERSSQSRMSDLLARTQMANSRVGSGGASGSHSDLRSRNSRQEEPCPGATSSGTSSPMDTVAGAVTGHAEQLTSDSNSTFGPGTSQGQHAALDEALLQLEAEEYRPRSGGAGAGGDFGGGCPGQAASSYASNTGYGTDVSEAMGSAGYLLEGLKAAGGVHSNVQNAMAMRE